MAIFRNVNMSFWTDGKIDEDFTPEEKYFMLFALTNKYTNIIGCYEITIGQMSNDLGYTKDSVKNLLKRFINTHKNIDYDFDTKELYIKNWFKYNWSESPKLDPPLFNAIEKVKSDKFHDELAFTYNNRKSVLEKEDDTVLIPYRYGIDTTITNTITNTISNPITSSIYNNNSITNNESIDKDPEELKPAIIEKKLSIEEEFEMLWAIYPNKKGKKDALKSYKKARTRKNNPVTYEIVFNAINAFNFFNKTNNTELQFIKHGSTWFNQECWNDDYTVIKPVGSKKGKDFWDIAKEYQDNEGVTF